jgi:PilZ domain-containing protein
MDSRQETRFETEQEVTATLLGEPEIAVAGRVVNFSGRGICLACDRPLPAGGALKFELGDTLVLGEVVYCRPLAASFQIGVALEQALYHTTELAALLGKLLGPARAAEPRNV